jgi:hypothetical protein
MDWLKMKKEYEKLLNKSNKQDNKEENKDTHKIALRALAQMIREERKKRTQVHSIASSSSKACPVITLTPVITIPSPIASTHTLSSPPDEVWKDSINWKDPTSVANQTFSGRIPLTHFSNRIHFSRDRDCTTGVYVAKEDCCIQVHASFCSTITMENSETAIGLELVSVIPAINEHKEIKKTLKRDHFTMTYNGVTPSLQFNHMHEMKRGEQVQLYFTSNHMITVSDIVEDTCSFTVVRFA